MFKTLVYVLLLLLPILPTYSYRDNIYKLINTAWCVFSKRVFSCGKIRNTGDEIVRGRFLRVHYVRKNEFD